MDDFVPNANKTGPRKIAVFAGVTSISFLIVWAAFFSDMPYRNHAIKGAQFRTHLLTGNTQVFGAQGWKDYPERVGPQALLTTTEIQQIKGTSSCGSGKLQGSLYNGTDHVIRKIVFRTMAHVSKDGKNDFEDYEHMVRIAPRSVEFFSLPILATESCDWSIVGASRDDRN